MFFSFYHLIIQLDRIHHLDESERFSPCQRGNEWKGGVMIVYFVDNAKRRHVCLSRAHSLPTRPRIPCYVRNI